MKVFTDRIFYSSDDKLHEHPKYGFFVDDTLYSNLRDFLIPAVNQKWDSITAVSGIEGCLSLGTTIWANGKIQTLEELGPKWIIVRAFDFLNNKVVDAAARIIDSGIKQIYEITTTENKTIKATIEHKFYIKRTNKIVKIPLKKIKVGDVLITPKSSVVITGITPRGKEKTYDLQVPLFHNFILGNDIISSNSGKSTIAAQIAFICDPSINIDRVVFTPDQLLVQIDASPPKTAIIFDEAVMGMLAQDAATAIQSVLIKKFVTIRKKRLFIFIVLPSIFLLRKYFAIFRTRCLIHTYTPDGITRGFFKFYSYNTKRKLYIRGMKEFDQGAQREDFAGRFVDTEGFFFDAEEYDKKKEAAIRSLTPDNNKEQTAKITNSQQKKLDNHDLVMTLAYQLFRFHIAFKNRTLRTKKMATEAAFSSFIKRKFAASVPPATIKESVAAFLKRNTQDFLIAKDEADFPAKKKKDQRAFELD